VAEVHYPWGCKTAKEYDAEFRRRKASAEVWQDGPIKASVPAPEPVRELRWERPRPKWWKTTQAEWEWFNWRHKANIDTVIARGYLGPSSPRPW
jgi:hypothetical protein